MNWLTVSQMAMDFFYSTQIISWWIKM